MWSDLTSIIKVSPNCSSREGRKIERITPHHTAGIATAGGLLEQFSRPARQASANYCIGNDGTIGGCVPEELRSWCSGSRENDTRSICIEISNDVNGEPWSIGSKAWKSAVALCADICLRYGFKLWWNPRKQTGSLTCHRWYQATACPGDWFYARIPEFMNEVNEMVDRITALENAVASQAKTIAELAKKVAAEEQYDKAVDLALGALNDRTMAKYHTVDDCPKWAKPTIAKLVKGGELKGDENGDLQLTEDLTRNLVITDRCGGLNV